MCLFLVSDDERNTCPSFFLMRYMRGGQHTRHKTLLNIQAHAAVQLSPLSNYAEHDRFTICRKMIGACMLMSQWFYYIDGCAMHVAELSSTTFIMLSSDVSEFNVTHFKQISVLVLD